MSWSHFQQNAFFDKKLMPTLDPESNRVTVSSKTAEGRHHYVLKCCTRTEMAANLRDIKWRVWKPSWLKTTCFLPKYNVSVDIHTKTFCSLFALSEAPIEKSKKTNILQSCAHLLRVGFGWHNWDILFDKAGGGGSVNTTHLVVFQE